jgi:hypothetical protein
MSPNAGGMGGMEGGVVGVVVSQPMSTGVEKRPNKLWRSNSIFNLWWLHTEKGGQEKEGTEERCVDVKIN